jgi:hypothetical protein
MDAGRGVASDGNGQAARPATGGPHAAVFGEPGRLARRRAEELEAEAHEKQADALRCWGSAAGEEATARELALLPVGFTVFHDLRRSRGHGNIDHLVIGPPGAFVIESTARSVELRAGDGASLRRHIDGLSAQGRDIEADLDGAEAKLIICLVSGSLPGPTVQVDQVVAVPLAGLVDHLRSQPAVLDEREVRSIVHLVHQRFRGFWVGADGVASDAPSDLLAASNGADVIEEHPANRFGRTERLVARLSLGLLVLAFGVVAVRCGVETVQGLAPRPTTSPKIATTVVCPTPGVGYSIGLAYPDGPHPEIAAFDVRALLNVATWVDLGTWRSAADVPDDKLVGIGPSTRVEVRSRTVFSDGSTLPEHLARLMTPDEPC